MGETYDASSQIIVAIDGHSSCGKSTMAKQLAQRVGYVYVDTGAMYRAVTLYALQNNLLSSTAEGPAIEEATLQAHISQGRLCVSFDPMSGHTLLNGQDVEAAIRTPQVSDLVSHIAALPFVRTFLVSEQQDMGRQGGIVMDGRDIGTTVFPQARLKVFVTAAPDVRARRRYDELVNKGLSDISYEDILRNVRERDHLDATRTVSPLRQAPDAILLDNSTLTPDEQLQWLLDQFQRATHDR